MPHVDLNLSVICMKIQDIWYIYSYGRNPSSRSIILLSNLTHPHTQCTYVHVPHTTQSCLYQTCQLLYLSVNMSILPPAVIFLPSSGASSFFYVCSVNKDTLAKVGISRTLGNKNCIASINRNIQIWIQMNETPKEKTTDMRVKAACSVHGIHIFQCLST